MFNFILDFIAPKKCYSCFKEWHFLCEKCMSKMSNFDSICYYCKGKTNNFEVHEKCLEKVFYDKIIIFSHYKEKKISKLIKDFKFYWKIEIWEELWKYISNSFLDNEIYKNTKDYIIIFPPKTFFEYLKRWYNSSKILAKFVWKNTWIKLEKNIIKKIKSTRQQSRLTRKERLLNLENAFKINKKLLDKIDKKIVIIVDDVISTWTTINKISEILKKNWAKKVIWLIIASD